MESVEQSTEPAPRKQVRWGTVSVLEFRVGYNASTVPESGGPPVGLVGRPTRHSYSMLPAEEEDAEASECESVDSDAEMLAEMPLLATGRSRRNLNDLWLDPMERARILAEEHAFPLEDVALICRDVRATLNDVTEMKTQAASDSCAYYGGVFSSGPREKVLLY
ncbi:hypothetical protein PR002_g31838 [Phytophthora rubi]|uniref:Uncharacterized protein n=1 Tax=Phytophthora rubi TaxID=129364 RepID=A0A6A3G9I2_9STRA|nr:hypothetical protein PR002_g31838 [Phytophthora rubi]